MSRDDGRASFLGLRPGRTRKTLVGNFQLLNPFFSGNATVELLPGGRENGRRVLATAKIGRVGSGARGLPGRVAGRRARRHWGKDMKRPNSFAERLLYFASSQKSIDRVAIWLGGTVSIFAAVLAVLLLVMLLLR